MENVITTRAEKVFSSKWLYFPFLERAFVGAADPNPPAIQATGWRIQHSENVIIYPTLYLGHETKP